MYRNSAIGIGVLLLSSSLSAQTTLLARADTPAAAPPGTTPAAATPAAAADTGITLATRVVVKAKETKLTPLPISSYSFTGAQVTKSAGTFGDLPRYLQTLPGLVGGSDSQNASSVRGGNSFENMFVIDKIEVPNINHLALPNSTGGLASMLDTESITGVTFHSADVDSSMQSHASSLTEIHTLEQPTGRVYALDLGYAGAGVRINRPLGENKSIQFSVRESTSNLITKDVGLNGSPEFTNSFTKFSFDPSSTNHFYVMTLFGRDGLQVRPSALDTWETNAFDTNYTGWRNTTGLVWQHTFWSSSVGTLVVSNSQNVQNVLQRNQLAHDNVLYQQNNGEGQTNVKYQYLRADEKGSSLDMGVDLHLNNQKSNITQAAGIFSPYSASATPLPAFAQNLNFGSLDEAGFANLTEVLGKRVVLKTGARLESYGLTPATITGCTPTGTSNNVCSAADMKSHIVFLPHASVSVLAARFLNFRAGYSRSAQFPPYATIGSAPGNGSLGLITSQQFVVGASAQVSSLFLLGVEAYRKTYSNYAVSKDIPQVSLAALTPDITEPFSAMAMVSGGKGLSQGIEISLEQKVRHHIFSQANLTFSSAQFTGSDGIYRSGSNDLPVVLNVMGGFEVKRFLITVRDTMTSGRPYTPIDLTASKKQDRMIYDLTKINAMRGNLYTRLDFAVNREMLVHGKVLRLHGGLINVMNRQNFYEYAWRSRCNCGEQEQDQMGMQPDFGMSYSF